MKQKMAAYWKAIHPTSKLLGFLAQILKASFFRKNMV